MGQLLRITYGAKDYSYQLLTEKPVTKETEKIDLLLEGHPIILVKAGGQWLPFETTPNFEAGLLQAIGKAISLRYRI
jgi:hypothetical protein